MVTIEKRENIEIVRFTADKINALITDEIRARVSEIFEHPNSKVIIDLKGVEYIDSSGFGCFLSIYKTAKNNYGILKIANPASQVRSLFETLHLHTVFEIYNDTEECIISFSS